MELKKIILILFIFAVLIVNGCSDTKVDKNDVMTVGGNDDNYDESVETEVFNIDDINSDLNDLDIDGLGNITLDSDAVG